jgi:hypothetical protein
MKVTLKNVLDLGIAIYNYIRHERKWGRAIDDTNVNVARVAPCALLRLVKLSAELVFRKRRSQVSGNSNTAL